MLVTSVEFGIAQYGKIQELIWVTQRRSLMTGLIKGCITRNGRKNAVVVMKDELWRDFRISRPQRDDHEHRRICLDHGLSVNCRAPARPLILDAPVMPPVAFCEYQFVPLMISDVRFERLHRPMTLTATDLSSAYSR